MTKTKILCPKCKKYYIDYLSNRRTYCSKKCYILVQKSIVGRNSKSFTHGMINTRFYRKFASMRQRCNDKNFPKYVNYGKRGIKILWKSFDDFKKDMYENYLDHVNKFGEKDTTIDRINVNGHYSKENCKWSTRKEQSNNKTNTILIPHEGRIMNVKQWSIFSGIKYMTLYQRIMIRKWPIKKCFSKEIYPKRGS